MDDKNNSKKMWNRNQAAVFSILFPLVASIPIGLFYGLIFQTGEPLLKKWIIASIGFYLFLGGLPSGGILTLVFRKWSEEFCTKAGNILWYGTFGGAIVISELFDVEASAYLYALTLFASSIVCSLVNMWYTSENGKDKVKNIVIFILAFVLICLLAYLR